jgi:hypothetical protein
MAELDLSSIESQKTELDLSSIEQGNQVPELDLSSIETVSDELDLSSIEPAQKEEQKPLTAGQFAGSLAIDIGGSIGAQAVGYTLAPFTLGGSLVIPLIGGMASNIAAQTLAEGKDISNISWGRAISSGLLNLIPGAAVTKTARPIAREVIKGATIGTADVVLRTGIDEQRLPTREEFATSVALGGGLGGAIGAGLKQFQKGRIKQPDLVDEADGIFGMSVGEIDTAILQSTKTGKELREFINEKFKDFAEDGGDLFTQKELNDRVNDLKLDIIAQKKRNEGLRLTEGWGDTGTWIADLMPTLVLGGGIKRTVNELKQKIDKVNFIAKKLPKEIQDHLEKKTSEPLSKPIRNFLDTGEISDDLAKAPYISNLVKYREAQNKLHKEFAQLLGKTKKTEWDGYFAKLGNSEYNLLLDKITDAIADGKAAIQYKALIGAKEKGVSKIYFNFTDKTPGYQKKFKQLFDEIKNQQVKLHKRSAENPSGLLVTAEEKAALAAQKEDTSKLFTMDDLIGKDGKSGLVKNHIEEYKRISQAAVGKDAKSIDIRNVLPGNMDRVLKGGHIPGSIEKGYLGEVTDVGMKMRLGFEPLAVKLAQHKAEVALLKGLKARGMISSSLDRSKGHVDILKGLKETKLDKTYYISPEARQAISVFFLNDGYEKINSPILDFTSKSFNSLLAASKAVKVIFNPPSYAVNGMSGGITLLGLGVFPIGPSVGKYFQGMKVAMAESKFLKNAGNFISNPSAENKKKFLDIVEEYTEQGIINGNIQAEDLIANLKKSGLVGKVGETIKSPFDFFGKLYSVSDIAARVVVYEATKVTMQKIFPALRGPASRQELNRLSSAITNDVYQNYDRLSRIVRAATRVGVMPQFVAFTAEFSRNMYNQATIARLMAMGDVAGLARKYGIQQRFLKGVDTGAMQREGTKRLAMLTLVGSAATFGPAAWNNSQGIDKETDDDIRLTLPSWMKNKPLLYYRGEGDNIAIANASYIMPHAIVGSVINAALDGEDERTVLGFVAEEFIGDGTFVNQELMRALDNRTARGKKITHAIDDAEKTRDLLAYVMQATFEPGFVREYEKFIDAQSEQGLYTTGEVLRRQLGLRFQKMKFTENVQYKLQDLMDSQSGYKGEYSTAYKRFTGEYEGDPISQQELDQIYEASNEGARKAYERMQVIYRAMTRSYGFTTDEAIEAISEKGSNLSKKNAYRIIKGLPYKDLDRTPQSNIHAQLEELFGEGTNIDSYSDAQIRAQLARTQRANPIIGKQLINLYRTQKRIEASGLSTEQKLLKSMSVEDRASVILELGMNNPKAKRELRSKGIWTSDVDLAIKFMQ